MGAGGGILGAGVEGGIDCCLFWVFVAAIGSVDGSFLAELSNIILRMLQTHHVKVGRATHKIINNFAPESTSSTKHFGYK